jgi:phosphosulfolactate synthase (CoM biosynthesis protein A)
MREAVEAISIEALRRGLWADTVPLLNWVPDRR